jgi:hypothetical protein
MIPCANNGPQRDSRIAQRPSDALAHVTSDTASVSKLGSDATK